MSRTLYNALIFPLVHLMEGLLALFYNHTGSHGFSIILLSLGVNILIAPFYALADKWQNEEQNLLRQMKSRLKEIREVFKGDERHFYLKALYRLHGYSPLMSIRSSFGLLIQIPFFMAAYNFLSRHEALNGQGFFFFADLARPDSLLGSVNIMPFVMTGINVASALLFTRGQNLRSRIQLFGMAGFFLVVLYNSPAGLLLYWTCNNLFSLLRILYKKSFLALLVARIPDWAGTFGKKITLPPPGIGILLITGYGIFVKLFLGEDYLLYQRQVHLLRILLKSIFFYLSFTGILFFLKHVKNNFAYHLNLLFLAGLTGLMISGLFSFSHSHFFVVYYELLTALLLTAIALPLIYHLNSLWEEHQGMAAGDVSRLFHGSLISLFLMAGCVIPLLLLGDVPGEIFLAGTDYLKLLFWAALYTLVLPVFFYRAFPRELRRALAIFAFMILVWALLDFLFFQGDYGFINNGLQLASKDSPSHFDQLNNILVFLASGGLILFLAFKKEKILHKSAFLVFLSIGALALFLGIKYQVSSVDVKKTPLAENQEIVPEIPFSKTEKNTLIIMLDRALGAAVPSALQAYPELSRRFSGFTWYKNTISYGDFTISGLPALLGGYDYTPLGMLERPEMPVYDKIMESWTVLPELFLGLGNSVYISDPSLHDLNPEYQGLKLSDMDVTLASLEGKYAEYWMKEHIPWASSDILMSQRGKSFFMFSLFRMAPVFFRDDIYEGGLWHSGTTDPVLRHKTGNWNNFLETLKPWSTLAYLPQLSYFQDKGAFNFIYNMTTHEPKGVDAEYKMSPSTIIIPQEDMDKYITESTACHMYTNIAAFKALSLWFDWMKDNGVYDNTQIVVVADHGRDEVVNPLMPLEAQLEGGIPFHGFQPLLLYKGFGASGDLQMDNGFMTNGDVPALVLSPFGNFKNPRTGTALDSRGKEGPQLVGMVSAKADAHKGVTFKMDKQFHVSGNSLDPGSWTEVLPSEYIREE